MSGSVIGIGSSALTAAQAGLVTTGHNIANANSVGYHRQSVGQSASTPLFTGSGFFGQGVKVETVVRAYSQFLDAQVTQASAKSAYYSTYRTQLSQIDNVLADNNAGLSPALQDFFQTVHAVAAAPYDVPSRQSMLSSGSALVARFNALGTHFEEMRQGINTELTSEVAEINSDAQQIAILNGKIVAAQQDATQPPNDLADQRDQLVSKLSQLIGTTVTSQSNGTINVSIGNGQSLVVGMQSMRIAANPALDDPLQLNIGYTIGSATTPLSPATLTGGSMGALLAFRDQDLATAQNSLGRVALGLAQTFNDQHELGQDLNGALGTKFFTAPVPRVLAKSTNLGTAVLTAAVADVAALTTSDYRLNASVVAGVTSYTLTRLSDNTSTQYASLPQTVDGITIAVGSGAVANGDSFLIRPTRNAAADIVLAVTDPAQIAAAAPIRTSASGNNSGSATISAGTVDTPPPPNANLQNLVTITFTSPTQFKVVGLGTLNPSGLAYTAGADVSYNGWTVKITGTPATGDVFTISTNDGGVADGRNALRLAGLQSQNTLAGASATYQSAYSELASLIGSKTQEMDVTAQAQAAIASQATAAQQSFSGVNLDEEAANLLRYQQAYQAAGKMMQIASTLFQTLLNLGQ